MDSKKRSYVVAGLLFLLGLNLFIWPYILKAQVLTVTFFDVGQGDAIFIETPQGHQILIDGGPDEKVLEKLGMRMPFWDTRLDLVILTHPEKDHVGGLIGVLEFYEVDNILWTGVKKDTNIFREWVKGLEKEQGQGTRVIIAQAAQKIVWASSDVAFLDILYPFESLQGEEPKNINDTSIVAKLVYGQDSFLLPGDISRITENILVINDVDVAADILKAAHHGSKSSSTEGFIRAVDPALTVIQVGQENQYGHPYQEVLERFSLLGIPILRTDTNGDIIIRTDGNTWQR
ncbi:MBL fold metallo-hydrolase [Patescibacteria group bacterium]|nr:MBL fold metallo-hydrolase [Patescibacteria group bacterium]